MTMFSVEPEGISQDVYQLNYQYLNMLQNAYPYQYQYDYCSPSATYPQFVDAQCLLFPVDNKVHSAPFSLVPQEQRNQMQLQEFQYFVVIDFEATCDKFKNPYPQEIIEFPSVIVNAANGEIVDCFRKFVRPNCNQQLTEFCKNLTGISQDQIDQKGVSLVEALQEHDKWLETWGVKNRKFAVVTWTNWDCGVLLESECKYKGIQKPPYFNQWINLKVPFRQSYHKPCDLKHAIELVGLHWQGRAHSGMDDAKNTALLLVVLMSKGIKLSITNALLQASADEPIMKMPLTHSPSFTSYYYYHQQMSGHFFPAEEARHVCHCGVKGFKMTIRKPGSNQVDSLYRCGHYTAVSRSRCDYYEWTSEVQ